MQIVAALQASRAGTDPTRTSYHMRVEPNQMAGNCTGQVRCLSRQHFIQAAQSRSDRVLVLRVFLLQVRENCRIWPESGSKVTTIVAG
jgi:hypothetical protein